MTDRSRLTTLAAIALGAWAAGAALPAAAQPGPGGGPRPQPNRPGQPPRGRPPQRPAPQRRPAKRPPPPPPGGPMAVGRRLPPQYRGYNYRVEQWQYYHLPRPRGANFWVQYGADYLEVSPAGIVIQIFAR